MPTRYFLILLCIASSIGMNPIQAEENWNSFRGSSANGHATATNLPQEWSEEKNITWKTAIHGRAWSSPVVWKNQIWLTTATEDGKEYFAVCLDRNSGKIIHDVKLFEIKEPQYVHPTNTYASSTPVIEEGFVYVHFGSFGTACLSTKDAKVVWKRSDFPCNHWRGPGSSPILHENNLILHYDGYDYQYIVALNKKDGKTIWKKYRDIDHGTNNGDFMKAFGTPLMIDVKGQQQLISPAAHATLALNPKTGKVIWRVTYKEHSVASRPLYKNGLLYLTSGVASGKLMVVKPTGKGDVTKTHVVWQAAKGVPSKPSILIVDDLLYMIHDGGVATCLEAKTGKKVWQKRVGGKYSASPMYADGHIYFCSHDGKTTVITPDRKYKLVATNQLGKEKSDGFRASPIAIGNAIYLRNVHYLYRIEKK